MPKLVKVFVILYNTPGAFLHFISKIVKFSLVLLSTNIRVGALTALKRAGISSHLIFNAFSMSKSPSRPREIFLLIFFLNHLL